MAAIHQRRGLGSDGSMPAALCFRRGGAGRETTGACGKTFALSMINS